MSKRVVLSGYYGFENLGDEAVLHSIIRALRETDPTVQITVLSADPAGTAARYGVEARNRWKLGEIIAALRSADLLISGGGSLLQDVTSKKSIPYYLGIVSIARLLGKKVAFYAQGVGPIVESFSQRLTRFIGNKVQLITVRDQESYNLLQRIGVTRPEMKVTADPVLLLSAEVPASREFTEICQLRGKCRASGRPLIAIAPRPWRDMVGFQQALVETARRLQERLQAEIVLIPMDQHEDTQLCQEMQNQLPGAVMLKEQYAPAELLAVIERMDIIVSIRLHTLIFAAAAGVPHVGITYDPKIDAFLQQMNDQPVARIDQLQADQLYDEVIRRLQDLDGQTARIEKQLQPLQEKAWANARMVLDLIN